MADNQQHPDMRQLIAAPSLGWPVRKCKTCKWQAVFDASTGLGNGTETACTEGKIGVTIVPGTFTVANTPTGPVLTIGQQRKATYMTPAPNEYGCSKWAPRFADATGTGPAN